MQTMIHILHLEDDLADAELVQVKLAETGLACRIALAQTRDEFETALGQGGTDIILSDYRLPMYNGLSALHLARERCPEIPFIFVSGAMGEEAAIEALTQGATDYVLKQNLSRLAAAVQRALQETRNQHERRQAQEALQRSNALLQAIIQAAPVAIVGLDLDGHVHSVWNPTAEKMLGWRAEEVIGRPLPTVAADHQAEFKHFRQQIRKGMTLDGVEVRRQRRDGTPIDYSIYASPLHDEQDRISGNIAVLVDITERKRTEAQLSEQLHFFQQLLDSIPVPVYYKDREGIYLGCNAAFEAFIGLPRKEIVGKTVHQVTPDERADEHHQADLALLRHPGVHTYEVGGIYSDGQHHDVIFNKATFVDANDCVAGTVGTLVDITERKEAEHQRLANLMFFESMDKVNRAIQQADSLEQMMRDVLDIVLSILDCERVYLLYPCDPTADAWTVPMERSKPGYAGPVYRNRLEIPMNPEMAARLQTLVDADGPVQYGPGTDHPLPDKVQKEHGFKSTISTILYPRVGKAWQFGIHQCSHARIWTAAEERLIQEIGWRLTDALTSLLAHRHLQESEERYRLIAENTVDTISIFDLNLKPLYTSPSVLKLRGYTVQEAMTQPLDQVLTPKSLQKVEKVFAEQMALEENGKADPARTVLIELEQYCKDGSTIWVELAASALRDSNLQLTGILTVSRDITERKRAEASIRKLSQAIEQSPVSIVITDVTGRIEFVNAKFTQVTGYTFEEALGENPRILKSGETPAEAYRRLWKTIASGGVWQGEFHNRKKNGELFWEQATIAPVRDADNVISHYLAVKEDITERKKLEAQLRQVQKMEAIGQLAGGIAHDFNNILSAITGYTEISISTLEPESPVSKHLAQVLEACARAKELINQILTFSRETEQELRPIRVSLPVKEALKLIRASVPPDIEIRSEILSRTSALADPTQIHQIVMNLCTNAAHAMKMGGGCLDVRLTDITIDHTDHRKHYPDVKPGEYIRLTVSDEGHGIDAHHIHRIFEPFFTTKEKGEGTGMGLSVVHGIVKSYGGWIDVHSRSGEGCTFEILFPALERAVTGEAVLEKPIPSGSESILFVDDETMIADIAKKMLESLGYHVAVRTNAIEALEAFRNNPKGYDLVITDLAMPKMSGLELAEKILQIRPELPIVLCTGFGIRIGEEKVARHGVRDIIYKPILRRDMAVTVRKTLDRRRSVGDKIKKSER